MRRLARTRDGQPLEQALVAREALHLQASDRQHPRRRWRPRFMRSHTSEHAFGPTASASRGDPDELCEGVVPAAIAERGRRPARADVHAAILRARDGPVPLKELNREISELCLQMCARAVRRGRESADLLPCRGTFVELVDHRVDVDLGGLSELGTAHVPFGAAGRYGRSRACDPVGQGAIGR